MNRRTTLILVLVASLAVACWTAWMAHRPICSCVLGDANPPRTFAEYADRGYDDPADCERHHGEVE